jgi:hypothetical protein
LGAALEGNLRGLKPLRAIRGVRHAGIQPSSK